MKPRFKVGPAKTRGGYDVYILEVGEDGIFGKLLYDASDNIWIGQGWWSSGKVTKFNNQQHDYDLMPNCEPEKIVIEKSDIKTGENGWFHVCSELENKINELVDAVNRLSEVACDD